MSVIVPARNEAGNIEAIVRRTPEMGAGTELIFVEGHSTDDTGQEIQREIERHPGRAMSTSSRPGTGKGDAVRLGFAQAADDMLMILDADLTVPPEELPTLLEALASGRAEFVNGVAARLPDGAGAMRFLNLLGNKVFSLRLHRAARPADQGHALRHEGAQRHALRGASPPAAPTSATSTRSATSTCCFGAAA